MAYTVPPTAWATNQLITPADLDTYITANSNELFARPFTQVLYERPSGSGDYAAFTSTSWADIDGTNLTGTITTNANARLEFRFQFSCDFTGATTNQVYLDFTWDGTRIGGTNGIHRFSGVTTQSYESINICAFKTSGVTAGSHTFKVQYKVGGSTMTIHHSTPLLLMVREF